MQTAQGRPASRGLSPLPSPDTRSCVHAVHADQLCHTASSSFLSTFTASFAPICFAIKVKENDLLPLEKNRVRLDDDSDEDKVCCPVGLLRPRVPEHHHTVTVPQLVEEQVLEALMGGEGVAQKEAPPPCLPEERKPSLSVEELEAKQGRKTHKYSVRVRERERDPRHAWTRPRPRLPSHDASVGTLTRLLPQNQVLARCSTLMMSSHAGVLTASEPSEGRRRPVSAWESV